MGGNARRRGGASERGHCEEGDVRHCEEGDVHLFKETDRQSDFLPHSYISSSPYSQNYLYRALADGRAQGKPETHPAITFGLQQVVQPSQSRLPRQRSSTFTSRQTQSKRLIRTGKDSWTGMLLRIFCTPLLTYLAFL